MEFRLLHAKYAKEVRYRVLSDWVKHELFSSILVCSSNPATIQIAQKDERSLRQISRTMASLFEYKRGKDLLEEANRNDTAYDEPEITDNDRINYLSDLNKKVGAKASFGELIGALTKAT